MLIIPFSPILVFTASTKFEVFPFFFHAEELYCLYNNNNISSQEKNSNLNRDSNLGPPVQVQVRIFLLRSDNVNFPRHKLRVCIQLITR